MSGPVPSRLAFLSDLQHLDVGEKVRFLGWYVFQFIRVQARVIPTSIALRSTTLLSVLCTLHITTRPPHILKSSLSSTSIMCWNLSRAQIWRWVPGSM